MHGSDQGTGGRPSGKRLSLFVLAMMNVAVVVGLEGLPTMGNFGLSLVVIYAFFAVIFFLPVGLAAAELGGGWPAEGGVYNWIKEAMGERMAFVGIWCQWVQIVVWYPTVLALCATSIAYMFNPAYDQYVWFSVPIMLIVFWASTLINFKGLNFSGMMTTICLYAGTFIPVLMAIGFAVWWVASGRESYVPLTFDALFDFTPGTNAPVDQVASTGIGHHAQGHPHVEGLHAESAPFTIGSLVAAVAVFSFLSGLEVNAVHFRRVRNLQRAVPISLLISGVLILLVSVLGALSVAVLVPLEEMKLTAGTLQVFQKVFGTLGIEWLLPVMAFLALFGMIGHIMVWVIGPTESLRVAASDGVIPPIFQKTTRGGAPRNVMLVQALVVSLICLMNLFLDLNRVFYVLTIISAQIYLVMYALMFISLIRLRLTQPKVNRPFRIPGGIMGVFVVGGIGLLGCLGGIVFGFFPPSQSDIKMPAEFLIPVVSIGFLVTMILPFIFFKCRNPEWAKNSDLPRAEEARKRWIRGD
ncbi:MAG: APC family permease [Phycisphaerales bacterium]|nr:APC family permease [Phycisphaerales bacterium]